MVTVPLFPHFFTEIETPIFKSGELSASLFRYPSGVCAVRMVNSSGEAILLPFQGQQIWSLKLHGRDLTMVSMFDQPRLTQEYLQTYGGFLLHCGFTAMGVPAGADHHPLHGELPNAPYQEAFLISGSDQDGEYLALGGKYQHTVAFSTNYVAEPCVKLYAKSSRLAITLDVTNLKNTPMEYMYLAHINFRPVNGGQLHYSAVASSQHVRVRTSIPSHVHPGPEYVSFLNELSFHPEKHHAVNSELAFDPEVVFFIDYLADSQGRAYTMQRLPDGSADFVIHKPSQLEKGVRWICRTPDQDAMGMILPATAEPEGYTAEKTKGNVRALPAHGKFHLDIELGVLSPSEAVQMSTHIDKILENAGN